MDRVLTSYRFLAATAVCCGLAVAVSIWAAGDASGAARALAGLIGLLASLAVMLLIAAAASDETPGPSAEPAMAPLPVSVVEAPAPPPPPPGGHDVLARLLDEGRSLRAQLEPASADPRVDEWIEAARGAIEGCRPGMSGYFNALAQRAYADDRLRLDAYTRRLETIVRGY